MDELLEKSEGLSSEFSRIFEYGPIDESNRVIASWVMCSVALEHSASLRQLVLNGNYTSAICIMRSQFEALTRALWLFYAASNQKVDNTMALLSERSQNADQKPNNSEMITKLEGKAPEQAVQMLKEFRDIQWKALNSYVHGGIHALQRHGTGYPEKLVKDIIKSSNGLLTMTAMMAAILTGNKLIVQDISRIQLKHKDCLPVLL
ncbi:hypothetical protein KUL42_22730 [Alteromonas sp. KUL42]|uniref:DUF6988 family protein n=1 Tax=Alteromonas sp. KUL42 TaxID=2480797 RepID=UPI001036AF0A|nr:hypothetical protein [Alteromonas sp. KUL42]TAP34768.1 hypothetical protein EYR97_11205 [Alteromonas sp. KUL42]GEA07512.1 hypothetical protein KUL42_22730 [Alteromonas sp. KUL42]